MGSSLSLIAASPPSRRRLRSAGSASLVPVTSSRARSSGGVGLGRFFRQSHKSAGVGEQRSGKGTALFNKAEGDEEPRAPLFGGGVFVVGLVVVAKIRVLAELLAHRRFLIDLPLHVVG